MLPVVYKVGNVVVDPAPEPICKVAPDDTCSVLVALPVTWNPPSLNVPACILRLPAIVIAPVIAVVTPDPVLIVTFPNVCPVKPPVGPVVGERIWTVEPAFQVALGTKAPFALW